MGSRIINFSAGPAGLPLPALEKARDELLDFEGTGMSIMEMSHRSKAYDKVHCDAIGLVRELLNVPENYSIMFLQGGANLQFAMLPMNILRDGKKADYIISGHWAQSAWKEACKVAGKDNARAIASTESEEFRRLPRQDEYTINQDSEYVHFCTNNTIYGTQFHKFPDPGNVPLVADMSSDIMWAPIDVSKFAFIYAGAQKNLGPSGVLLAIMRNDFLEKCADDLPTMLKYKVHAEKNSLYNTPPTFGIYLLKNVLEYNKSIGGLAAIERNNRRKGELLYGCIDGNAGFYRPWVTVRGDRSLMNVDFHLPTPELDAQFIAEATKNNMTGLKGYRTMGGIRVSMYNAVSVKDIETLVAFMNDFMARNA